MKVLLIVYDNDSFIHYFPLGIAYLAAVLRREGHSVTIYDQAINHYSEDHLTGFIERFKPDFVGIGSVAGYYPYRKILKISEAINRCYNRSRFKFIIGGHMASATPEYFLKKTMADAILVGEGDLAILDIVNGSNERIIQRELIKDLDKLPFPAYDLFNIDVYRLQRFPHIKSTEFSMSILSGRGCSFNCTFCYRMYSGIRLRRIDKVVEEIKLLKDSYDINYIEFADDLTMSSERRAIELSEALMPLNIKWQCEGRLNYASKDLLKIMRDAGCVFINYGIESLDKKVLQGMKKALTKDIIIRGIETTLESGISPGFNFIWGNIGDTPDTLNECVDFLIKYDDGSQIRTIRPVTPYPGCELFNVAVERGLVKDVEDFYENKHVNSDLITINFTDMSLDTMYKSLYDANLRLLNNYTSRQSKRNMDTINKLYVEKDTSFRGWRHT